MTASARCLEGASTASAEATKDHTVKQVSGVDGKTLLVHASSYTNKPWWVFFPPFFCLQEAAGLCREEIAQSPPVSERRAGRRKATRSSCASSNCSVGDTQPDSTMNSLPTEAELRIPAGTGRCEGRDEVTASEQAFRLMLFRFSVCVLSCSVYC